MLLEVYPEAIILDSTGGTKVLLMLTLSMLKAFFSIKMLFMLCFCTRRKNLEYAGKRFGNSIVQI